MIVRLILPARCIPDGQRVYKPTWKKEYSLKR